MIQVTYFDTIKNDISRPAKLTEETSTSRNEGGSFSCSNSVFTGFDEGMIT